MRAGNDSPSSSRALVVVAPVPQESHPHRATPRPAAFLAHLIATARQVPQTRERRRAELGEVIAAYQATIDKLRKLNARACVRNRSLFGITL